MPCTKGGNHSFLKTWVTPWRSQPKMHRSDRDLSYKSAIIYFNVFISVGQYYLTCSGKTLRSSVSVGSISARSKFSNLHYLTVFAYKTEGKFLKYLLLVLLKSPNPFKFHRMKNISQLKPEPSMEHARASAVFHLFKCLSWSAMHQYVFKNAMILVGSLLRRSISNFKVFLL